MGRSKDPILSVRLPGDIDQRLTKAAEKLDLSKNDIARHAIRAAVAAIEANKFKILLPLEMSVASEKPVESRPQGAIGAAGKTPRLGKNVIPQRSREIGPAIFAEDIDAPSPSSIAESRLNEDPPKSPPPGPRARSTRPGVEKTVEHSKSKKS